MSDEWVLVPKEATENMVNAGLEHTGDPCFSADVKDAYVAMLAAAPPPPTVEGDLAADNHRLRHHMRRVIAEREIYRAALDDIAHWPDAMGDLWKKRAVNAIEQAMQK